MSRTEFDPLEAAARVRRAFEREMRQYDRESLLLRLKEYEEAAAIIRRVLAARTAH